MNTSQLLETAKTLAIEAGKLILEMRGQGVSITDTKSSVNDIVTKADAVAEKLIASRIAATHPDDSILGEEGTSTKGKSEITWIIDPIDGTVNYLYNIPAYCVSIAACVKDANAFESGYRAVASAVYNPSTEELFYASENSGAFLNNEQIQLREPTPLNENLVATGFGYTQERRQEQLVLLTRVLPSVRDIRRIGSAAYDLCLLAAGRLDGYFEKGIKPWDWAAGALIATEAGALLLGIDEANAPGEKMFIAGHPQTASALQKLIAA